MDRSVSKDNLSMVTRIYAFLLDRNDIADSITNTVCTSCYFAHSCMYYVSIVEISGDQQVYDQLYHVKYCTRICLDHKKCK